MKELQFRLAQTQDLHAIHEMFQKAIEEMEKHKIYQWDEAYPSKNDLQDDIAKQQLYVGIMEGQVACAYALNQEGEEEYQYGNWQYPNATHEVVHRLCVNPFFQKQGIGTRTIANIEKQSKALGMESVRLDAFAQNPHALKLYRKSGYQEAGVIHLRMGAFILFEKKL